MKTDIEIAKSVNLMPISQVAKSLNINNDDIILHGNYMAKVKAKTAAKEEQGKLILVTAINPTMAGEGKTTVSIGLADGMKKLGKSVALALREPSLGPVFGTKGGATGGGFAQIAPMEDINLHFTGDFHAITSANNLLSAMADNHVYWGNQLNIKTIFHHRCMDMNDRALRNIVAGLNYFVREDNFDITAASEVMAALCLAKDDTDLKERLGNIVVGETYEGKNVTARDLKAHEAMAILLKEAVKPNLVQTLGGTAAFIHGGPFANIAHGCNSIIATKTALSYADYVVTEAGFGADLGAEKFFDIKCRAANLEPKAVVIVATLRALKCAGGKKEKLGLPDKDALLKGIPNLTKHIENIKNVFGLSPVVALNMFSGDSTDEIMLVKKESAALGASFAICECWAKGGEGSRDLAREVISAVDSFSGSLKFTYDLVDSVEEKIIKVATKIYGADGVVFEDKAKKKIQKLIAEGYNKLPVCIAKTQYSLSDNPLLLGRPSGFKITVRDIALRAGAGFLVVLTGDILLMPGLSKAPNAENMQIDKDVISGLF